jgi:hypothetical protein
VFGCLFRNAILLENLDTSVHPVFFVGFKSLKSQIPKSLFYFNMICCRFFLKMPNIVFSVMRKPFIKCVIRQRVGQFLHSRKKLIRRFQKKKRQYDVTKKSANISVIQKIQKWSKMFHWFMYWIK